MTDKTMIVRERQLAIRREIDRRGIALKAVACDSGIGYGTLLTYFPAPGSREPACLPTSALYALAEGKALPLDLLSMLLPVGVAMVFVPEEVDHHEAAAAMQDFLSAKARAHHPDSPAGEAIAPCEDATLRAKLAVVRAA